MIFISGGSSKGSVLSSVDCYDPKTGSWSKAASMSKPRNSTGIAASDSLLFIAGGFTDNPSTAESFVPSGMLKLLSLNKYRR